MEYETYEPHRWSFSAKHTDDVPHYFGHTIRRVFFFAAFVMLATLPFFRSLIDGNVIVSIFVIIALVFAAGYTNPHTRWIIIFDVIVSCLGLLIFGFSAIQGYTGESMDGIRQYLFITNQVLAITYLIGFYFSVKTLRGFKYHQSEKSELKS